MTRDRSFSRLSQTPKSLKRGSAFRRQLKGRGTMNFLGLKSSYKDNMRFEGHVDANIKRPDLKARRKRFARLRQTGLFLWSFKD